MRGRHSSSLSFPTGRMHDLKADDQAFILSFVRHSGSLKEMAKLYEVSYPAVRNRLDDLIAKLPDNTELKESADESTDPR